MPRLPWLLLAALSFKLVVAQAQSQQVRSSLPGCKAQSSLLPLPALPGGGGAAPAPIPTVGAAAAYSPLAAAAPRFNQPLPPAAPPPAPRRDLTRVGAAPVYDPYQNWPEAQRKSVLWAEPLPLPLLRSVRRR